MTVAIGPSLVLREQLQQHAARAGWLVLLGPLPAGEELVWIQVASQAGVPVLAMVPGYEQGEELKQELQEQGTGGVTLCSELLGAESGEVCWYRYNDARHNGTTPPELLQAVWPNLKLESLELRPTRRLDGVLSVWLEQAGADAQAPGLLWLPATEAAAVLSGAGAFLERLEAIWLEGSAHPDGLDVEVLTLLEASCHRLTIDGAQHQLWQLDQQRLLERQVVLLTQQREVLQGRVQELEVQLNAQSAQTAEQSQQREVLQGRVQELEVQLNAQSAQTAEQSQQREVLQGRVQELEVQLNAQSAQTAEQSQQREVLQGRVQELEVQLNAQSAQTAEQSQQREVLQGRVQELEVQLNAQSAQTAEQSQQREVLQGRVQELEVQLNAQSAQTAEQSQQREVLQGRVQELEVQLNAQSAQTAEQSQQREVLQGRVQELEVQHTALSMERERLKAQSVDIENSEIANLSNSKQALHVENEELKIQLCEKDAKTASEKLKRLGAEELFCYAINKVLTIFYGPGSEGGSRKAEGVNLREFISHIEAICLKGDVDGAKAVVDVVTEEIDKFLVPLQRLVPKEIIALECAPIIDSGSRIAFGRPSYAESIASLSQDKSIGKTSVLTFGAGKTELSSLFDAYGSDKDSNNQYNSLVNPFEWLPHSYALVYERIFSPIRQSTQLVFECGIGSKNPALRSSMGRGGRPGASLRAWKEYFHRAIIHGADIDRDCLFSEDRIVTHHVNQTDPFSIRRMWREIGDIGFDVIIDDGLHEFEAGSCLFTESFQKLRSGGIYIIEDVAPIQWQRYIDFFGNIGATGSIVSMEPRGKTNYFDNAMIVITKD